MAAAAVAALTANKNRGMWSMVHTWKISLGEAGLGRHGRAKGARILD